MNIGAAIKKCRKKRVGYMRQADFCNEIGVDPSYLSHIENNKRRPAMDLLEDKICKGLGIPVGVVMIFSIEKSEVSEKAWETLGEIKEIIESEFLTIRKP